MTFFRQLRGSPLAWLFTLISLAYFVRGLGLARSVWQRRQEYAAEPLQQWKKGWAERAAFYVAVPPGVFIHELGHALAIWGFGGTVTDVGYGFYWGYVVPQGSFTAFEDWFISLSGTLGTLLYGFLIWAFLRRRQSSAWRYFGLRTLRFHLYYALLYYPLFTLFTFIGDWRTIYDFQATPLLSGATLGLHVAALALFWWSDRRGWYEMPAFQSAGEASELAALKERAARNPQDERLQLSLIERLRQRGAGNEAQRRLRAFLQEHPRSAEAHLSMALVAGEGRGNVSRTVRRHAEEALQLGLRDPANEATAHTLMAQYYLQVEKSDEALRHLDEALANLGGERKEPQAAHLHYLRALAQRRRGAYPEAQQEIGEAIRMAEELGHEELVAHYQNEQRTIAHHLGQQATDYH